MVWVQALGIGVYLGSRVQGYGFSFWGLGFGVSCFVFWVRWTDQTSTKARLGLVRLERHLQIQCLGLGVLGLGFGFTVRDLCITEFQVLVSVGWLHR